MSRRNILMAGLTGIMMAFAIIIMVFIKADNIAPRLPALVLSDEEKIYPWYNEKEKCFYYFVPSYADLSNSSLALDKNKEAMIDDEEYSGNKEIGDRLYNTEYLMDYNNKQSKIIFAKSENVSTMYVTTATGSMEAVLQSKKHKEVAKITIVDKNGKIDIEKTDSYIKGRGNTTWSYEKKPFSLIFCSPESILGMGQSSKWVLLANAIDYSAIRNAIVFDTAHKVGLHDTSEYAFVDLYLNGEYYGLYTLCQSVETLYERSEARQDDSYLFTAESKSRLSEANYAIYVDSDTSIIDVRSPEKLSTDEENEAQQIIRNVEDAITEGGSALESVIDIDSWAKKYLIDEIFENCDAGFTSSFFYSNTKDGSTKVYGGPIWDYDRSLGNTHCYLGTASNPECIFADQDYKILWYSKLNSDPNFHDMVINSFEKDFIPVLQALIDGGISNYSKEILYAKKNDDIRWNMDSSGEYDDMTGFLSRRLSFLKRIWLDHEDFVEVGYYTPNLSRDYIRAYLPRGTSLSSNPECLALFDEKYKWYVENTGEEYDFDSIVYEDLTLSMEGDAASNSSGLKEISSMVSKNKKIIFILISMGGLFLVPLVLRFCLLFRRGGPKQK